MKKETLADKIAKKTFLSADFQKQWAIHMGAFGPILGPAFAEDYQSRIHLTAALNHISRRDVRSGLKKLQQLQEKCETNGFAFDFEVLMLASKLGLNIREMPVRIINHRESKVNVLRDSFRMLRDLAKIKIRIRRVKFD